MEKAMKKVLVVLGPTATGKSDLAVKLARKFKGEVISADSRQVYKGLNIGTGKVTKEEMRGVHHWLLDVVSPKQTFTVADWKKAADEKVKTIFKRSKLPIICGGTGFYIQSVVDNVSIPEVAPNKKLRQDLGLKNTEELQKILRKLDKNRFDNIDKQNPVRLIRAIEIATALGSVPKTTSTPPLYEVLLIGLRLDEKELRSKIHKRLEARIKKGMITEAQNLHKKGLSLKRMKELGLEYRYLALFLEKRLSLVEMKEKLETEIWHYAKRQMTWFKRDKRIQWFSPTQTKQIEKLVKSFLG